MKKAKKKRKKGTFIKILEYTGVYVLILITRVVPLRVVRMVSDMLGDLLYFLVPKRRTIALDNLRNALQEKNEQEIQGIARQCCRSFFLTFLEIIKLRSLITESGAVHSIIANTGNIDMILKKAKRIHDSAGGCIFVTPHIGSWELLPHISSLAGIPLVIVVRPLDNEYLEKLIYANRASSGQLIIPKKNALYFLQKTLKQGKSVGILPDQSTMKGISVDFFGRRATTTPIPALLGIRYNKPIVVAACCRDPDDYHFRCIVGEPIWPGEHKTEKKEIFRLTEAMNREMETIIRKFPEQYLWIHNRWKTYEGKKEFLA